ncbi:MAG: type II toxin-antitoxin system RelE/ParE family toxin [Sphaerospermopsis kisseleviana]|jgi:proteic killer suppression protein|uniref:type II toxin-antitoxin system RelE/ParE family toxin n=1 Tax=Sphaerospermopsis aphanizomenoides TaxID=459663 RepID=UPI001D13F893|nr:type II toxin-antitoxin system RelE/ParE family toxin [Sphaerospermopsis aphanizomenoides]
MKAKITTLSLRFCIVFISSNHAEKLLDLLDRLDAASVAEDMNFPGSRFHQLTGNRKGEYSVTVSGNWRLTFVFEGMLTT